MAQANGHIVYCAGPMFSPGDLVALKAMAEELDAHGFTAYVPPKDGIEVATFMALIKGDLLLAPGVRVALDWIRKMVFALDMYQLLKRCDCLIFNMDGRVPDDGSVSEAAAAFAAGRPIVIYKTTPITMLANRDNPLIQGLSYTWQYVDDVTKVPGALSALITELQRGSTSQYSYSPPPRLTKVIAAGEMLWQVLEVIHRQKETGALQSVVGAKATTAAELDTAVQAYTALTAWDSSMLDPQGQKLAAWFVAVFHMLESLHGEEPDPEVATKLAADLTDWANKSTEMSEAFPTKPKP